jgi:hypothetical protein
MKSIPLILLAWVIITILVVLVISINSIIFLVLLIPYGVLTIIAIIWGVVVIIGRARKFSAGYHSTRKLSVASIVLIAIACLVLIWLLNILNALRGFH